MQALADLTPKQLTDRKRALRAVMDRRDDAIRRARADRSEAELLLGAVQREIDARKARAKGNSRRR